MDDVDDLVSEGATSLGSFPAAYHQLTRMLAEPSANADRIAATVRVDPALTARILQFVNAGQRATGRRIESVAHAVMLLGRRQLREVATASAVVHLFRGIPEHLVDMGAFWRHSIAVGLAATHLARAVHGRLAPNLFVPGVLHDVGALLLYLVRPRDTRRILIETENRGVESRFVEVEQLGADHGEIGARLQTAWSLPEAAIAAARFHHRPSEAPAERQMIVDLVHLADVAVSALQVGNAGERCAHALDEAAWERSQLTPELAYRALVDLAEEVEEIATLLAR